MEGAHGDPDKTPPDLSPPPPLLRDLNYLDQKNDGAVWTGDFRELLNRDIGAGQGRNVEMCNIEKAKIVQGRQKLLDEPPNRGHKELYIFYSRMCRERQNLFAFCTSRKSRARQRVRTFRAQRQGKTEDIGSVQDREDGAELRPD